MTDDIRSERLARIADGVRMLVAPFTDRQPISSPHAAADVVRRLRHPSILDQLRAGIAHDEETGQSKRPIPESAAPPGMEAVERLDIISGDVRLWLSVLHVAARGSLEDDLRALVGLAPQLGDDDLRDLDRDVAFYVTSARVYCGWETPPWRPRARCYVCGSRNTLRVRYDVMDAICLACNAMWDRTNIGILAEHVSSQGGEPAPVADGHAESA